MLEVSNLLTSRPVHPQCIGLFLFMTTAKPMTIFKGKFMKDGKEVKPEHGNKEQIDLLKKASKMAEGFYPEISIKKIIIMEFRCLCGAKNEFDSFSELDEDDPYRMIRGEKDRCHYCGLEYKVTLFQTQHSEYLQLTLVTNG